MVFGAHSCTRNTPSNGVGGSEDQCGKVPVEPLTPLQVLVLRRQFVGAGLRLLEEVPGLGGWVRGTLEVPGRSLSPAL